MPRPVTIRVETLASMHGPACRLVSSSFDEQALLYDERAGLPAAAGVDVARAIVAGAGVRPGGVVIELGAGTGEIGTSLEPAGSLRRPR